MAKLLIKLIVFLLLVVGICSVRIHHAERIIDVFIQRAFQAATRGDVPELDLVFLGDSRFFSGVDIPRLKEEYGFSHLNLSTTAQNFTEAYFLLKRCLENHPVPRAVFLCYTPDLALQNRLVTGHFDYMPIVREYYMQDHEFFWTFLWVNTLQRNAQQNQIHLMNRLRKKKILPEWGTLLGRRSQQELRRAIYEEDGMMIWGDRVDQVDYLHTEFRIATTIRDMGIQEVNRKEARYFGKLIDLAKKNRIRVGLFLAPINEYSRQIFTEYVAPLWYPFVESYEYTVVDIDPRFYPSDLFTDDSHLNIHGRERYTRHLIERGFLSKLLR